MTLIVSTPSWKTKPDDQNHRCRYFIKSSIFEVQFSGITRDLLLETIDANTTMRRGGPVGDFSLSLLDINGDLHEFYAESFFNTHYIMTIMVHSKKMNNKRSFF